MSRIRGKDTKPEIKVRRWLYHLGFRYRKNYRKLAGSPDIALPKYKTVIFINGCFWHGHDCKAGRIPKSNSEFWEAKIEKTKARDQKTQENLNAAGWKVIVLWECEIMDPRSGRLLELVEEIIDQGD